MKRRNVIVVLTAALLVGAAVWLYFRSGVHRSALPLAQGPIVIISIDTLRADRLPAYGYTGTKTPNIDRLAADGVLFENAYAHSPQTLPSHASILSGQLPFEHGVRDNVGFNVRDGQRLLQHELKDAGFATGGFVSSYVLRRQTGIHQGFDAYDDELPPVSSEEPLGQVQRRGEQTIAAAVRWVDAQPSGKFFLFAHIYEPHTPYSPPERFVNADRYDGEVEFSDEIVGALLNHLRQKNLYDAATIVLLSDHGEGLGDHGEAEHGIFLYRETIRVPLIIKLPGSHGGGRRVAAAVQHIDLVPTLGELYSIRAKAQAGETRGRSLVPVLTGGGSLPSATIYAESLSPRYHFGWSELFALSDDRYRYIRAPREELYDLARDAAESTSIAAERPQVRSAMRSALDAMIADARVAAPTAVSAEDRQKLAALGYVGTQTGSALELAGDRLPDPKDKIQVLDLYRRGTRLSSAGKYAEAADVFRRLLEKDPDMSDAWLQLAEAYNRQGMLEEALGAYKQMITRNPQNPAALTGAAGALLRMGRIDEARAHAELAVGVAPVFAHELLARIAAHRGDAEAARRHAGLAQKADPTLPMPQFVEGLLEYRAGRYETAATRLLDTRQALSRRTEQLADVNYLAGDSLARIGRYEEAEPLFRAELALRPSHIPSYTALAMLYRSTGRDRQAEEAIDTMLDRVRTGEAVEAAARLWTMFGEHRRAAAVRVRGARGPG